LEKQTRLISDQIGRTAKLREANIAQFEKLGIRKELGMEGNALYRVPFYVTCFQAELKKRLFILPPSVANTIGFATKLKGALGMTKVKGLLVSRFKSVASLTDTIQVLMQQNAVFEAEMKELGESANILNLSAMREGIKNGLLCLKNEGWLSEKEYDAIRQKLT
jgi:hypothetical protein